MANRSVIVVGTDHGSLKRNPTGVYEQKNTGQVRHGTGQVYDGILSDLEVVGGFTSKKKKHYGWHTEGKEKASSNHQNFKMRKPPPGKTKV